MQRAVLAAALTFDPRLAALRAPVAVVARGAGAVVLWWLDRRRALLDHVK
jgi:hypothetical protein